MTVITCNRHQFEPAAVGWRRLADLRWLNLLLIAIVAGLFVGYLVVNNRAATSGFALRSLEQRVGQLESEQRVLELQALDRQSMSGIENRAQELGFVPVGSVQYLTVTGGTVALK